MTFAGVAGLYVDSGVAAIVGVAAITAIGAIAAIAAITAITAINGTEVWRMFWVTTLV